MYPVNIQLKLSDREQLKFLEEIISLLHVHQDREGLESNLAMGVTPPMTHVPNRYSPCVSEEEMEGRWNASSNVMTALKDTTLPSFDSTPRSLNHTSFEDGSSIFPPHPPTTHPPPSASSSSVKFRRIIRPQPQKLVSQVRPSSEVSLTHETTQKHTDSIEFELRPQHYLNEAELALISSQHPLSFSQSGNIHSYFVPKSSESDFKFGRREATPLHIKSEYWLKETNEQHLQEWLLKKDRDCLLQRKRDLKRRQLKCRERAAKAAQASEKAEQAKVAYQKWLDGKRAENRRQRSTRKRSVSVQPMPEKSAALHSEIQPRPPNSAPPQSSIIRRLIKASKQTPKVSVPLTNQQNKTSKTTSKRLTFKEWIQLKEKEKASKKTKVVMDEGTGQLPEDLQKIARGMRKLRLQHKDYSKRHVDSGLPKRNVGCVDAKRNGTKSASSPIPRRDPKQ